MPAQSPNPRFPGAEKVVSHYKQGFSLCLTIFRRKRGGGITPSTLWDAALSLSLSALFIIE